MADDDEDEDDADDERDAEAGNRTILTPFFSTVAARLCKSLCAAWKESKSVESNKTRWLCSDSSRGDRRNTSAAEADDEGDDDEDDDEGEEEG